MVMEQQKGKARSTGVSVVQILTGGAVAVLVAGAIWWLMLGGVAPPGPDGVLSDGAASQTVATAVAPEPATAGPEIAPDDAVDAAATEAEAPEIVQAAAPQADAAQTDPVTTSDAGTADAGMADAGLTDTGLTDTGTADAETNPTPDLAAASDPVPAPDATPDAAPDTAAAAPQVEPETAPGAGADLAFDTVRAEPDGSVLVAGTGRPGTGVAVLVDGIAAAIATVDGQGKFVALFTLTDLSAPRVLSLGTKRADGTEVRSIQSVVLAPRPAAPAAADTAVASASAGPDPEPAPAPAPAPAALMVDQEGIRLIAPPDAPANIVIDTITYDDAGEVQLAGRAGAAADGGYARVYVNNQPILVSPIEPGGGWASALPEVETGVYTLRVDQIDAEGKVVSRFETPFQREAPEAVAAAQAEAQAQADVQAKALAQAQAANPAPEGAAPILPSTRAALVTVQPGFTLWAIATETYGDGFLYVRLYEANRDQIRDPDLIYPGQMFALPN